MGEGGRGRVLMAVLWDGQSGCGVSDQAFFFLNLQ